MLPNLLLRSSRTLLRGKHLIIPADKHHVLVKRMIVTDNGHASIGEPRKENGI